MLIGITMSSNILVFNNVCTEATSIGGTHIGTTPCAVVPICVPPQCTTCVPVRKQQQQKTDVLISAWKGQILEYASVAWDSHTQTNATKIEEARRK